MPRFYAECPDRADPSLYTEALAEFNANPRRKSCPYVVFGHIGLAHVPKDSEGKIYQDFFEPRIYKLDIGSIHGTISDLARYTAKGWIVLDYWIPTAAEVPNGQQRGDVLVRHGWAMDLKSEEGQQRMRELKQAILIAKGETDKLAELKGALTTSQKEKAELERKVKEYEAKLSKRSPA